MYLYTGGGSGGLVAKTCVTLAIDPMDCSLAASSVHGILQERILECIAISFSRESSWLKIEPSSPALQANSLPTELWGKSLFYIL